MSGSPEALPEPRAWSQVSETTSSEARGPAAQADWQQQRKVEPPAPAGSEVMHTSVPEAPPQRGHEHLAHICMLVAATAAGQGQHGRPAHRGA